MRSFPTKKVIVTGLTFTMLLGGMALYGSKLQVYADAPAKQQAPSDQRSEKLQPGEKGSHKALPILDEAATILGMEPSALSAALKEKTLADIAKEKGISEADLIAKLKAVRIQKIDEAVKAGKLQADQAEKIKASMDKHLAFMVNHKGGFWHGHHRMKHRALPEPAKIAAILGITEEQLKTQLHEGKSLAEIAAAKGISKDQLIVKIKDEMTPWIEKMVEHKRGEAPDKKKEAK
ncbi:hypothetical protein SK3146_06466 [Paenibacillus konkukensis]|uniref:LysM domain-containing protein n=1 Tax=Paenibacillus konkukensis TaxID=2020716 RepID=A0ABY4RZT7_9BACL|nr:hypothetical protein [Paenibacillus konkukensis]UQZ87169.1 hypothetical protein SK3146_06466 [Paenibacillus konkukensis]